jgi:acetyl esterase/lipase
MLRLMKTAFAMIALLGLLGSAHSQPTDSFPLWPDGAPGALGKEDKDIPTLTPFFPPADKASGAAMVVLPGGGYGGLASHEGKDYALWLNEQGITAFVLKYRLGPGGYRHPAMLQDAARAIRLVRAKAGEWKLDPKRIGIMGSSAGGHLASTLLTHFDAGKPDAEDPIDRQSSRTKVRSIIFSATTLLPNWFRSYPTNFMSPKTCRRVSFGTLLKTLLSQ